MNYINILPKELRNELRHYENHLIHSLANKLLKTLYFMLNNIKDFSKINENKYPFMPLTLNTEIMVEKSLTGEIAFFKIHYDQLVTIDILNEIFNNTFKLNFYGAKEIYEIYHEINDILCVNGYINRLQILT